MKRDIENRADVELLVNRFYEKVREDQLLNPIFSDVAKIDWTHHLPRMYDFWSGILIGEFDYKGNPMVKHMDLDKLHRLEIHHFNRWLALWAQTLDELFEGQQANEALLRAEAIAATMQFKINKFNR